MSPFEGRTALPINPTDAVMHSLLNLPAIAARLGGRDAAAGDEALVQMSFVDGAPPGAGADR